MTAAIRLEEGVVMGGEREGEDILLEEVEMRWWW